MATSRRDPEQRRPLLDETGGQWAVGSGQREDRIPGRQSDRCGLSRHLQGGVAEAVSQGEMTKQLREREGVCECVSVDVVMQHMPDGGFSGEERG